MTETGKSIVVTDSGRTGIVALVTFDDRVADCWAVTFTHGTEQAPRGRSFYSLAGALEYVADAIVKAGY
jgi:hypothetical protein